MRAIDLFAGVGGFSEGARLAGCRVVWAANHWRAAVDVHARNHPDTEHACQDLHQADWSSVPAHDLPRRPHVPVSTIIDFDAGNWTPLHRPGRAAATIARVKSGRARFGDRFVAPFYGSGSGETGRSLDRPLGTITTRDRWLLVDGDRVRILTVDENRAGMGFRSGYALPERRSDAVHMLGNAVCPVIPQDLIDALRRAA